MVFLHSRQLDISDDGFLSLMDDNGDTKDDVRVPEGEVGDKINKLFKVDEKDTSESSDPFSFMDLFMINNGANFHFPRRYCSYLYGRGGCYRCQGSPPWCLNDGNFFSGHC